MKPPSVMNLILKDHRQQAMIISACKVSAYEGSPARHVDSTREAGNKKTLFKDGEYNMLIINCLI
jgi:hypothetical protein